MTLDGLKLPRILSFIAGSGMIAASVMTMDHFFKANYPKTIFAGSFCDISAFFNCDSSAFSKISQIMGIPLGFFGMFMGLLVVLGAVFPSEAFERTNKSLSLLNVLGVITLFLYSVLHLGSLCLLCSGFYLFSIIQLHPLRGHGHRPRDERPGAPLGPAVAEAHPRLRRWPPRPARTA